MKGDASADQRDAGTPDEVIVNTEARVPDFDPTLGITVKLDAIKGTSTNKLVTMGDSVTMGFQSGAIYNTRISWPNIIAAEVGVTRDFDSHCSTATVVFP